jgi:hypothetical protein
MNMVYWRGYRGPDEPGTRYRLPRYRRRCGAPGGPRSLHGAGQGYRRYRRFQYPLVPATVPGYPSPNGVPGTGGEGLTVLTTNNHHHPGKSLQEVFLRPDLTRDLRPGPRSNGLVP